MVGIAIRAPTFQRGCIKLARSFENSEIAKNNRFLKPGEIAAEATLTEEQAVGESWSNGIYSGYRYVILF